ncbi:SET domain and mariner transposase fusion protein [Elysia marginata]|uniref:SET domain and mariner transposase fusion protein n=1 Tax=Elysia marginata TaxID=1093978 RepID=A0AAV4JRX8_9GAST|nr:SET domain and mariner transposase fusion protein [Elysia marginata]
MASSESVNERVWVHHYDPEYKIQTKEHRHTGSPGPQKFKFIAYAKKVLMMVFWTGDGLIPGEFWSKLKSKALTSSAREKYNHESERPGISTSRDRNDSKTIKKYLL